MLSAYKMLKVNQRGKVGKEAANISYHSNVIAQKTKLAFEICMNLIYANGPDDT